MEPGTYRFRIVNVFTVGDDRLSGNPLCVFEDARGLSDPQMQALARQMNLSETTFVLPSQRASAQVRIFTPSFEMPFAGHPTLGTAHVVRSRVGGDRVSLEMRAGIVDVTSAGDRWTLRAAKEPATRPPTASRAELAAMVGLPADAISDEPLWVNTGVEQLVLPIRSAALVRAARPIPELVARHGLSEPGGEAMAYLWSPEASHDELRTPSASAARPGKAETCDGDRLVVRFFFTQHGALVEDPATGSACANLGGWHIATGKPLPVAKTLSQGEAVGRPSQLDLRVDADRHIYVTGTAIEIGRGTFIL